MSDTLAKGDRVVVVDLRTGKRHPGVLVQVDQADRATVRYDSGGTYRMHKSFVRKDDS